MNAPYTYETLFQELEWQPDLIVAMHDVVAQGHFVENGTWRRAICEYSCMTHRSDELYRVALRWACYLYPDTDATFDGVVITHLADRKLAHPVPSPWYIRGRPTILHLMLDERPLPEVIPRLPDAMYGPGYGPLRQLLSAKTGIDLR